MPPKDTGKPAKDKQADKKGKDDKGKDKGKKEAKKAAPPPPPTPTEVFQRNLIAIDKYVDTRDRLYLVRAMRYTGHVRQHVPMVQLKKLAEAYVTDAGRKQQLLDTLSIVAISRVEKPTVATAAPDVEMSDAGSSAAAAVSSPSAATASQPSQSPTSGAAAPAAQAKLPKPNGPAAVELEVYLQLLALSMLEAQQKWTELGEGATKLLQYLSEFNRRTLDFFQARAWSLVALAYERQGGGPAGLVPMRPSLITAHRTACLRHDEYGQSVLINILLRSYVETKEIDSAASLLSKASFPESASNAQLVRKLYYEGRVKAVQLQYSESHAALMQALRKSPPSAVGFQTIVQKFAIVVQMLMGDLPERSLFSTPGMKAALKPYLELTRSVRAGDVKAFGAVVASDAAVFERDGTDTLVRRLEANVIKTGLRRIATSYSKISFKDIAAKLSLSSAEDAEFLAAKAIRDGVIDGSLDHEAGTLEARGAPNVYGTKEPQEAFHRRIAFTLDVHDASVRAMRYPAQALRADLESAEAARERLREEAEFVNALDEGKDMDDDDEEM